MFPPITPPPDRRSLQGVAWGLAVALSVWSFVGNLGLGERLYLPRNLLLTVLLLLLARAVGVTASEMGLGRGALRRGAAWGAAAIVIVAIALLVAVAIEDRVPFVSTLLADDRAALAPRELAYHAALRIPFGTALFEEVAFRGVLLAALVRSLRPRDAIIASSVVFGLWHVAPTIVALRINDVVVMSGEGLAAIVGAVAVTFVAGIVFCLLRWRSGSLLAPTLAHWATNSLGLLAAASTAGS